MVRLVFIALFAGGCTLLVNNELEKNPGGCAELIFDDGSPSGLTFHSGVTAVSFRGPAYPAPLMEPAGFVSSLVFTVNGAMQIATGLTGDTVNLRGQNFTPTWVSSTAGHQGPGNFGCSEALSAGYDSLHDTTTLELGPAGCGDDQAYDGGTFPGTPDAIAPALGWSGSADGGAYVAVLRGTLAESCPETFPLTCFPPQATGVSVPASGLRRVDSLIGLQGDPAWIVSTAGADVRLYSATFAASASVVSWSGPIAAVATDVGIAMRISSGELQAQLFDVQGNKLGSEAHFALGDTAAHGLEIARFGTTAVLRIAWIGGDGQAHIATYDATVTASQSLGTPHAVCGSQGATFVAPASTTTAAVLIGDALYLRHTD